MKTTNNKKERKKEIVYAIIETIALWVYVSIFNYHFLFN